LKERTGCIRIQKLLHKNHLRIYLNFSKESEKRVRLRRCGHQSLTCITCRTSKAVIIGPFHSS
jgi:hypothetical protein